MAAFRCPEPGRRQAHHCPSELQLREGTHLLFAPPGTSRVLRLLCLAPGQQRSSDDFGNSHGLEQREWKRLWGRKRVIHTHEDLKAGMCTKGSICVNHKPTPLLQQRHGSDRPLLREKQSSSFLPRSLHPPPGYPAVTSCSFHNADTQKTNMGHVNTGDSWLSMHGTHQTDCSVCF